VAKEILELHRDLVSTSFEQNKALVKSLLEGSVSPRLVNRVAGYLTALARRPPEKEAAETPELEAEAAE